MVIADEIMVFMEKNNIRISIGDADLLLAEISRLENIKTPINMKNTSGVVGVHWDKKCEQWKAKINVKGESIFLGRFDKKEDAIAARMDAELSLD